MYQNNKSKKGFTLVELMIAVGFVGSLLILIALVIVQIMGLYNKGLTLKSVNEVSRTVVRDMQQSISSADYFKIYYAESSDPGMPTRLVMAKSLGEAEEDSTTTDYYSNNAGGRLCTGVYSYAWNTGAAIQAFSAGDKTYDGGDIQFIDEAEGQPIRFVKAKDPGKALCRAPAGTSEGELTLTERKRNLAKIARPEYKLLPENTTTDTYSNVLVAGNGNLVMYKFSVKQVPTPTATPAGGSGVDQFNTVSTFYSISMVLGTQNGDESENGKDGFVTSNESCKPPGEDTVNDGEYCAVNKIDFVARAGRIGE